MGSFKFTTAGDILTQANTYLSTWNRQEGEATWFAANSHPDGRNQNLVGPPSSVPEPGTMALLGMGALGLVRRARKRT